VARFSDKLQLSTRTMDTEVDVPNPSLVLIPGMYAEVNLTLDKTRNVLAVPLAAVDVHNGDAEQAPGADSRRNDKPGTVMVVTPDNRIEVRKLRLGLETANFIEVLSGLQLGDLVVIGNRGVLQPGERVRPKITTIGDGS